MGSDPIETRMVFCSICGPNVWKLQLDSFLATLDLEASQELSILHFEVQGMPPCLEGLIIPPKKIEYGFV